MKILFVCSSNICRSPYSEYVFKRMVNDDEDVKKKIEWIRSAAVFNKSKELHPKARLALEREGFDAEYISEHRPTFKWGGRQLFQDADIIIGMTKSNKIFLPLRYHGKFTTLSEIVEGQYKAVPDPFLMKSLDDYFAVMDLIKGYLNKLCQKIKCGEIS